MNQTKSRRRRRKKPKLEFEASKVFDVKPAHDLEELDIQAREELRAFKAAKGEGGDRGGSGGGIYYART